jgi:hypothetical protein
MRRWIGVWREVELEGWRWKVKVNSYKTKREK